MKLKDIGDMLTGITGFSNKVAYESFPASHRPALPFIAYSADLTRNFFAENKTYAAIYQIEIVLLSRNEDLANQKKIEQKLDLLNVPWQKENDYSESEKCFMTTYQLSILCEE